MFFLFLAVSYRTRGVCLPLQAEDGGTTQSGHGSLHTGAGEASRTQRGLCHVHAVKNYKLPTNPRGKLWTNAIGLP